jgi:hypothetical protein
VLTNVKDHWNPAVVDGNLAHVQDSTDSFLCTVRQPFNTGSVGSRPLFRQKAAPSLIVFSQPLRHRLTTFQTTKSDR